MQIDFDQETVDAIREAMPLNMRKQLFERINHNKRGAAVISYSTITDVLKTYREYKNNWDDRYRKRRLKVYNTALDMLREKGYNIETIIKQKQ